MGTAAHCVGPRPDGKFDRNAKENLRKQWQTRPQEVWTDVNQIALDYGDAVNHWWSSNKEADEEITARMNEVFVRLKYELAGTQREEGRNAILVSHSLYLQQVIKNYTSNELAANSPGLVHA